MEFLVFLLIVHLLGESRRAALATVDRRPVYGPAVPAPVMPWDAWVDEHQSLMRIIRIVICVALVVTAVAMWPRFVDRLAETVANINGAAL